MTRLSTTLGALALAAIAVAYPGHARPRDGGLEACLNRCYSNPRGSVERCTAVCRLTAGNNTRATARRNPNPAPVHSGSKRH